MTSKHTPGPWETSHHHDVTGYPCYFIHGFGGAEKYDRPMHDANARLIQAAPDLLAAAKDALAGWRYIREHHGDLYGVGWDRVEASLDAAIAKAEGRS